MCTAMLTSWDGTTRNLRERVALAVTARSPIARLLDFKRNVASKDLQMYSDATGDYTGMSAPTMATSPASPSSLAAIALSATSGAER